MTKAPSYGILRVVANVAPILRPASQVSRESPILELGGPCVVALTLIDERTLVAGRVVRTSELLLGVRRRETNREHGGVASVPTKRVPESLLRAALSDVPASSRQGLRFLDGAVVSNESRPGAAPLSDIVETILARKLGLADALELGSVRFDAQARVLKTAVSPVFSASDLGESMTMLNVLVKLRAGRASIPSSTASYDPLSWLTVDEFLRKAVPEQTLELGVERTAARYLCGGLCVCTSDLLLRALEGELESS
jgi:hypothetical protein